MEHEVTSNQKLLNKHGQIEEPGWARSEVWKYNRENISAPWFRVKEWDYYLFTTDKIALAFTISDLGYIGMLSASFIDLEKGTEHTESELEFFPRGKKYGLGISPDSPKAYCKTKRLKMSFGRRDSLRAISVDFKDFDKESGKDLKAELLIKEPDMESVYIATPWKDNKSAFYYNCKRNCLEAFGTVTYGNETYKISPGTCFGCLDWGRGVWTYDNTWYWGTGSGKVDGELVGLNLGYGFSDRSSASENGLYYKGRIHKLRDVEFLINTNEDGSLAYTKAWKVVSKDGRINCSFTPILDRAACIDLKVVISDQHQVFGHLNGYVVTDEGEKIILKDFVAALEKVRNKY